MDDLFVNMAITTLLLTVKNPDKALKLKAALLKVRNAINAAFPGE